MSISRILTLAPAKGNPIGNASFLVGRTLLTSLTPVPETDRRPTEGELQTGMGKPPGLGDTETDFCSCLGGQERTSGQKSALILARKGAKR